MRLYIILLFLFFICIPQAQAGFKKEFQFNVVFQSYAWHSEPKYADAYLAELDRYWNQFTENADDSYYDRPEHETYNEVNDSFGLEFIGERHGLVIGVYRDSYHTRAKYIAGLYLPVRTKYIDFGFEYGVVKSPSYLDNDLLFMILPYFSAHVGHVGFNLLYIPKFTSKGAHVIGLQLKVLF